VLTFEETCIESPVEMTIEGGDHQFRHGAGSSKPSPERLFHQLLRLDFENVQLPDTVSKLFSASDCAVIIEKTASPSMLMSNRHDSQPSQRRKYPEFV
jgi:hypothetical protein